MKEKVTIEPNGNNLKLSNDGFMFSGRVLTDGKSVSFSVWQDCRRANNDIERGRGIELTEDGKGIKAEAAKLLNSYRAAAAAVKFAARFGLSVTRLVVDALNHKESADAAARVDKLNAEAAALRAEIRAAEKAAEAARVRAASIKRLETAEERAAYSADADALIFEATDNEMSIVEIERELDATLDALKKARAAEKSAAAAFVALCTHFGDGLGPRERAEIAAKERETAEAAEAAEKAATSAMRSAKIKAKAAARESAERG